MFSRPFRKHKSCFFGCMYATLQEGLILWTSREWVLFKKECPIYVTMAKPEVHSVTQHDLGIGVNKQVEGRSLHTKTITMRIEHAKS
jgi:hypothetical protein